MCNIYYVSILFFFFQAEDGIRDHCVTGVQTCALPIYMLFASTPVRLTGETKNHARVEVILKDVYRMNDRIYVRYTIQNQGQSIYPETPDVFSLRSPRSPSSLYTLTKCQLVGDALRIKSDGQASVKVVSAQVR